MKSFARAVTAVTMALAATAITFTSPAVARPGGVEQITQHPATAAAITASQAQCPEHVVIAARGSDQNDPEDLTPTKYVEGSRYTSNGYEAQNIRPFLQYAEAQHQQRTGESLLKDTLVLGVNPPYYEAALPLPDINEGGEELDIAEATPKLMAALHEKPAHQILHDGIQGMITSALNGIPGTARFIADYERASGCAPQYVLIGYSQGTIVANAQEETLAERGQLGGVLSIGNPMHKLPNSTAFPAGTSQRYSYCIRNDFICDTSAAAIGDAIANSSGVHARYFMDPHRGDSRAASTFASWFH